MIIVDLFKGFLQEYPVVSGIIGLVVAWIWLAGVAVISTDRCATRK